MSVTINGTTGVSLCDTNSVTTAAIQANAVTEPKVADGALLETSPNYGIGYGTGAGGTVTQTTSRTTAVTLNKPTGSITMFSAAGSTTWSAFKVNNSIVSYKDTVILTARAVGGNAYLAVPCEIIDGSFYIAFASIGGTATDTPIINFAIIKGATA